MFNNDVTQTYTQQDATLEILIMLAGAFLLGCLLCWLIRKLIAVDNQKLAINDVNQTNHANNNERTSSASSLKPQSLTSNNQVKIPTVTEKTMPRHYSTPRIDDLTKISGINTDIETELRARGIKSYTDLRDSSKQSIIDTLNSESGQHLLEKEAQTWPHQASLAAKGEWEKLNEYQDFMLHSEKTSKKVKKLKQNKAPHTSDSNDDLKIIEGIGPKIEEILNNKGIYNFKDLRMTDRYTLKSYLDSAGTRFKMHDPQSWPHQAGMAERGEWEELKIYQEFMGEGEIPPEPKSSKIDAPAKPIINEVEADYNKELSKSNLNHDLKNKNDLKIIEGIGPKIEEVLNKNGISTFDRLHTTDRDTLKSYLDIAGPQFKMHEPESWPHQAGMAATGQWEELKIYQEFMEGGRDVPTKSASPSLPQKKQDIPPTSLHVKEVPKNEFDDLKKIEGIGPKIQELLNNADIKTYEDLKNSNSAYIRKLLDAAGPQYRMHEPKTWPTQALLAYENNWEELEEYQEEIIKIRIDDSKE